MSFERLKELCEKNGNALAASFKNNGDVYVYISKNADDKEIEKSLIILVTQISTLRKQKNITTAGYQPIRGFDDVTPPGDD